MFNFQTSFQYCQAKYVVDFNLVFIQLVHIYIFCVFLEVTQAGQASIFSTFLL